MAERSAHFIDEPVPVTPSSRDINRDRDPHRDIGLAGAEVFRSMTDLFLSIASVASGSAVLYAGFLLLLFAQSASP